MAAKRKQPRKTKSNYQQHYFLGVIAFVIGVTGILGIGFAASQSFLNYANQSSAQNPHPLNLAINLSSNPDNKVTLKASWLGYKNTSYLWHLYGNGGRSGFNKLGRTTDNFLSLNVALEKGNYTFSVSCSSSNQGQANCPGNLYDGINFNYPQ